MPEVHKGFAKIIEESSELNQVFGKLIPFPDGKHPDGTDLNERIIEELTDLQAAISYYMHTNNMQMSLQRFSEKLDKFHKWGLTGLQIPE